MSRYKGPKRKYQERFGLIETKKSPKKRFIKKSTYGITLEEKQKAKFIYGVMEKQFLKYIKAALKSKTDPGFILMQQLERRLDNVIYKSGFSRTIWQARQLVSHGHILVNGKRLDIPSYQVNALDQVEIKDETKRNTQIIEADKENKIIPSWLSKKDFAVKIIKLPDKENFPKNVDVAQIISFYTR